MSFSYRMNSPTASSHIHSVHLFQGCFPAVHYLTQIKVHPVLLATVAECLKPWQKSSGKWSVNESCALQAVQEKGLHLPSNVFVFKGDKSNCQLLFFFFFSPL